MYQSQPNLDVYQMQADLEAQSQGYTPMPIYGDQQANLTGARAAYGDIPAMMMSGAGYAGSAGYGAVNGLGNMFSAVGSQVMPVRYTPPARVNVGYYGQYQQETSFLRGMAGVTGLRQAPQGTQAYRYGYYNSADFGERVGGGAVAAATVATGMATGAPIGSMIGGAIGGALGAPLGPIGMGVGSAVGSFAGMIAGYSGVDTIADIVAQRRQMNSFLESSSFRYVGAGSSMADPRLGSGMSTEARRSATDFVRKMDIKDPNLNTDDLFGILQGATSSGLLNGVKDMEGFKSKFKDIVEGVKSVAKTLNMSLQEGLQVMKDLKGINIEPSQMSTIGFQAEVAGKISGRTAQEVIGLGMQGAELFRGTGIEMKLGYQSNVMNIASVRAARDAGLLSQEAIVQAGGEEALSQRMTASGLQFMQSAAGRGFGAAFFNPGMGQSGFNKDAFSNFMGKGGSMVGLAMQSAANLAGPDRLIQYEAYQDKFMSEMGKAMGGDTSLGVGMAAMSEARMLVDSGATKDMKAAFRLTLMRSYNMSPAEADTMYARIQNAPNEFKARMDASQNTATQRTVDEAMSTVGFGYLYNRGEDIVKGAFEPVVRGAENVIDGAREGTINFWERNVVGLKRADLGGMPLMGAGAAMKAAGVSPGVGQATNLDDRWTPTTKALVAAGGTAAGFAGAAMIGGPLGWAAAAGVMGAAGVAVGMTSWAPSTGRAIKKNIEELSKSHESLRGKVTTKSAKDVMPGDVILEENPLSGTVSVIKQEDYGKYETITSTRGMTSSEAAQIVSEGKGAAAKVALEDIVLAKGFSSRTASLESLAQASYGTSFEKLDKGQRAQFINDAEDLASRGITDVKEMLTAHDEAARSGARTSSENLSKQGVDAYDRLSASTSKIASDTIYSQGGYHLDSSAFTPQVAANLARARAATSKEERAKYLGAAEKAYYSSGKVTASGAETHGIFTKMIDDKRGIGQGLDSVLQDLGVLEKVQEGRGKSMLGKMLAQEISDPSFAGDKQKVQALFDKASIQGLKADLSKDDKELLGSTGAGKVLLQSNAIAAKLEEADKKAGPNATGEVRAKAAKDLLGELNLGKSLTASVLDSYRDKGVTGTKDMLSGMVAQSIASDKFSSGPRGTSGSPEAMGSEQGTGQEKDMVQMNINVQILSALNALAANLSRGGAK